MKLHHGAPAAHDKLDKLFQVDNNIYNSLVKDRKKALGQLERTRAWRCNKAGIASIFAVMDKENPSKEHQEALKNHSAWRFALRRNLHHWRNSG